MNNIKVERYVLIVANKIAKGLIKSKRSNNYKELLEDYKGIEVDWTKTKYILNVFEGTILAKE